ncbi:hypothetical protein [Bradyrhizobium sp. USDA 4353]
MPNDQAKIAGRRAPKEGAILAKAAWDLQSTFAAARYDILAETITGAYRAFT